MKRIPVGRVTEFNRQQIDVGLTLNSLQSKRPTEVAPVLWECVWVWTRTFHGNISFSPEHVSLDEMCRLRDDLNEKLKGRIDLNTLAWIGDRLGKTGPHGR